MTNIVSSSEYRNSFVVGRPVSGDQFFGRIAELNEIQDRLHSHTSVVVTGERRAGKTSVLNEFARRLASHQPKWLIVELDGQVINSADELLFKIAQALYDQSKKQRLELIEKIILTGQTSTDRLGRMLDYIEGQNRVAAVFINDLDDFLESELLFEGGRSIESFLRYLIERGHMIVCAVAVMPDLGRPKDKFKAPLFNVFRPVMIRPFPVSEAHILLQTNSQLSGDKLTESECAFIISMAGTKPYHLQEYGFHLFRNKDFVGSSGGNRLNIMDSCADCFAIEMLNHWLYLVDLLPEQHKSILADVAMGNSAPENSATAYLIDRGLLGKGDEPFQPMGELFKCAVTSIQGYKRHDTATVSARGIIDTALKETIKAGIQFLAKSIGG